MMISIIAIFVVTLLLQVSPSVAYSQQDRNCNGAICLTSFQWCDGFACDFPDGTLAVNGTVNPNDCVALVHSDRDYNITWKNYDITQPVQLTWTLKSATESTSDVQWITNTSQSFYTFNADSIFQNSFTQDHNVYIKALEGRAFATGTANAITISQPNSVSPSARDTSQHFSIQPAVVWMTVDTQSAQEGQTARDDEAAKWIKGIEIGIPVSVASLILLGIAIYILVIRWLTREFQRAF